MTTIFPQPDTIQNEQFKHFDFSLEQRLIRYIEIQQKKYDSLESQFMQEQYENQILQEQILKRSQELELRSQEFELRSQELELRSQELELRSQELEFSKVHNNVLVLKNKLLLVRIESLEQKEKEQQIVAKSYESKKALQKSVKELHDRLTTIMEEL